VCASYAYASHYLLTRYGIENAWVRRPGHAWVIVNYHDEYGQFTENDDKWCIYDATNGNLGKGRVSWHGFNSVAKEPYSNGLYGKHPSYRPSDGEHQYYVRVSYEGGKIYEW
jgi:hypothetical protein